MEAENGPSVAGQLFVECRKDLRLCSKGYSRASGSRYNANGGGLNKSLVECALGEALILKLDHNEGRFVRRVLAWAREGFL